MADLVHNGEKVVGAEERGRHDGVAAEEPVALAWSRGRTEPRRIGGAGDAERRVGEGTHLGEGQVRVGGDEIERDAHRVFLGGRRLGKAGGRRGVDRRRRRGGIGNRGGGPGVV